MSRSSIVGARRGAGRGRGRLVGRAGPGAVELQREHDQRGRRHRETINVAVVADVDNTIAPGVLKGIVDGVQGWGKYVNANGGIGGRKVQVDFIDSHLNPNDTRNAIIKACSQDFALVGTGTLLLQTPADITSCADSAGKADWHPRHGGAGDQSRRRVARPPATRSRRRRWSAPRIDKSPQTYRANNGDSKYLLKQNKGTCTVPSCSPATRRRWSRRRRCSTRQLRRRGSSRTARGTSPRTRRRASTRRSSRR